MLPSPGSEELNKPAEASREVDFVNSLLKGGLGSAEAQEAKLQHQVAEAVGTLEAMKQAVVNRRFGLDGQRVQTHEAIAQFLSVAMTPEFRRDLAHKRGINSDAVVISAKDVQDLEIDALRDLRSPRKKENK